MYRIDSLQLSQASAERTVPVVTMCVSLTLRGCMCKNELCSYVHKVLFDEQYVGARESFELSPSWGAHKCVSHKKSVAFVEFANCSNANAMPHCQCIASVEDRIWRHAVQCNAGLRGEWELINRSAP